MGSRARHQERRLHRFLGWIRGSRFRRAGDRPFATGLCRWQQAFEQTPGEQNAQPHKAVRGLVHDLWTWAVCQSFKIGQRL